MFRLFSLLISLLALAGSILAQTRGVVTVPDPSAISDSYYRKIWVLSIGTAEYKRSQLNLKFPLADADAFANLMRDSYGVTENCISRLRNPTKANILEALNRMSDPKIVGPSDAVIIYVSGHGTALKINSQNFGWLIAADSNVSLDEQNQAVLNKEAIPMANIWEAIVQSPARHMMLFADTCAAGTLVRPRGRPDIPVWRENFARVGREAMVATTSSGVAKEDETLGHGRFTSALLAELKARASTGDPFLIDSIFDRVREQATSKDQLPTYGSHPLSFGGVLMMVPTLKVSKPPTATSAVEPAQPEKVTAAQLFQQGMAKYRAGEFTAARLLLEKSAEMGDGAAMCQLGYMIEGGEGFPVSFSAAFKWYERSVEAGNSEGMLRLGRFYQQGLSVAKDIQRAFLLYTSAAKLGNAWAINNVGICYQFGFGVGQDFARAKSQLLHAASLGYPAAYCNLGVFYEKGLGVKIDPVQARIYAKQAAELGDDMAMNNFGNYLLEGFGGTRDFKLGRQYLEKAAARGVARAMLNLGTMYENGNGVAKNRALAVDWYNRALMQGQRANRDSATPNDDVPEKAKLGLRRLGAGD